MATKAPIYLKRGSRKGKKEKLRDILSSDMISPPLGDFRHTIHIGGQGDTFGDISFLQGNFHLLLPRGPRDRDRDRDWHRDGAEEEPPFEFCRTATVSGVGEPPASASPLLKNAISLPALGAAQAITLPRPPVPTQTPEQTPAQALTLPQPPVPTQTLPQPREQTQTPAQTPTQELAQPPEQTPAPALTLPQLQAQTPTQELALPPVQTQTLPQTPAQPPAPPKPPRLHLAEPPGSPAVSPVCPQSDAAASPAVSPVCPQGDPAASPAVSPVCPQSDAAASPAVSPPCPRAEPSLAGSLLSLQLDLGPSMLEDVLRVMDRHRRGQGGVLT